MGREPFTKIYTDGSWKKQNTVASLLLNTGKVVAGRGMVLTDGNFFSPICKMAKIHWLRRMAPPLMGT